MFTLLLLVLTLLILLGGFPGIVPSFDIIPILQAAASLLGQALPIVLFLLLLAAI